MSFVKRDDIFHIKNATGWWEELLTKWRKKAQEMQPPWIAAIEEERKLIWQETSSDSEWICIHLGVYNACLRLIDITIRQETQSLSEFSRVVGLLKTFLAWINSSRIQAWNSFLVKSKRKFKTKTSIKQIER